MPKLDGTGPDGAGRKSGRGLGECNQEKDLSKLGKGQGMQRSSSHCKGKGEGKRLKSGLK